jgi:hypothetical protein
VCKKPVWLKDLTHNTVLANLVAHYRLIERDLIGADCHNPDSENRSEHDIASSTVQSSPQQPPSQPPATCSPCRSASLSPPAELAASPEKRHAARHGDAHEHWPSVGGDDVDHEAPWADGEAHVPDSQERQELREENVELEEAIRDIDDLLARAPDPNIHAATASSHIAAEGAPVLPAAIGSAGARRNPNSTLRTVLSVLQQGHAMASLTSAQLRLTYRCVLSAIWPSSRKCCRAHQMCLRARDAGGLDPRRRLAHLCSVPAKRLTTKLRLTCCRRASTPTGDLASTADSSLSGPSGRVQGGVRSDGHAERGVAAAQAVESGPSHGGGGGDRRRCG